ncbi:reverse transcriptase domain-containing protein [Citrus sinensis]|uniref:Reverse transcriptase domain-containing protein n=1 Tax=Citrus sinensis TaxID=2711 RepID=A0ACB8L6D6_CITSI|nr:reverse transcriptase domain-containing protein [Citrus sinensis]
MEGMTSRVSEDMNEMLEKPFSAEEVMDALSQMCPTKAPGPDGLPAVFYQKHWHMVKDGVLATCLHILNSQGSVTPINHTYIALIPKVRKPRKVTEFRPISLCNVIYRIVAKSIANRFKQILHKIISPTQSAFIPHRLITDNIIVGYECLHKIRHCKSKRKGLVALKLDVSKAYDRLEWSFLEQIMKRLGFSHQWISLIMRCISSVSFSIIINGSVRGFIKPQRGLRQGCPLSPYLFITCAEAFSSLLQQVEQQRLIHGLSFGKELKISHLLFTNDSLVFCRASVADCTKLKMILDCYSMASGQIFNFEKSSFFLSGNVQQAQATAIGNIFHLNIVSRHENYLGLPAMVGRKRSGFFNDIKLKVLNKISSWQYKFFSCGGKEVLIKAAVQAIPAFAMSVFKIPLGICEDIQRIVANFWWGSNRERRSIHWSKWEKMSQAKCKGGMGFRDYASFNQALLAKQGWRIQQCPDSLVARVLQARYFHSSNFLNAKLGSNPSYIWRSILWGRQIICAGSRWRIGNGQDVHIHKANWIPQLITFKPVIKPTMPSEALVSELINGENCWDEELIYRHFDKMDADVITQIPLPRRSREDELIWHYGKSGQYTVKSGYQTALKIRFPAMPSSSEPSKNEWNIIWSLALPQKIRIFIWRAAKNLLPSAENLWKRKIVQEPTCQRCKMGIEDVCHALVDCKAAKKVWRLSFFDNDIQATPGHDILSLLHGMTRLRSKADVDLFAAILWAMWNARNQWLFTGKRENPQSVVAEAEAVMEAYKRVQPSADINTDAATNSEKNLAGLGAVIRDETGQVTAAAIKVSKFHGSVAYAEAEAMEWGLQVARDPQVKEVLGIWSCIDWIFIQRLSEQDPCTGGIYHFGNLIFVTPAR